MRIKLKDLGTAALVCGGVFAAGASHATLSNSFQFVGNGNWSIDGVGSNNTPVGDISAIVPVGSTVEKAFLYSSTFSNTPAPSVDFDGTVYSGIDWTNSALSQRRTSPASGLMSLRR